VDDQELLTAEVSSTQAGVRLDQALAQLFPQYSRSRLTAWIREGRVLVDGKTMKPKSLVLGGESIELTPVVEANERVEPEPIDLDIHYEDEAILIINKPAGLVVHPAAGNWQGTLQNGLLHYDPSLSRVPRAGIVHRLDKQTSGLMVVARTLEAHTQLVEQLQQRSVRREYLALVQGELIAGGTVNQPIGRHPVDRKRMAVVNNGKEAITHYRIEERFHGYTLLRVSLETGRTHQIRVHMAHIQNPLLGDPVYGGRLRLPAGISEKTRETIQSFNRQALHATRLGLIHPVSQEEVTWEAAPPEDMQVLLAQLRTESDD
jgi:23S rRNA pseudouridine1911/1915/1917 synthase